MRNFKILRMAPKSMIPLVVSILFVSCTTAYQAISLQSPRENFVGISTNTFLCKYETSNLEYQRFLADIMQKDSNAYGLCTIDTAHWAIAFNNEPDNPLSRNYHLHAAFDDYPVVGVSYDCARNYCKWLTDNTTSAFSFRLPTEKEYQSQFETLELSLKKDKLYSDADLNYNGAGTEDGVSLTTTVTAFVQNNNGLSNIIGNVAEITNEGWVTGGSWISESNEAVKKKRFTGSGSDIGFRVVMEIEN